MDLTTRCPQCGDEFPVSLQQLQLRKGYIRCANCAHIFDAYEAVVPATTAEPAVAARAAAAPPSEPRFSASHGQPSSAGHEPRFVFPASDQAGVPIRTRDAAGEPPAFTVRDPGPHSGEARPHTIREAAGLDAMRRDAPQDAEHRVGEPRPQAMGHPEHRRDDAYPYVADEPDWLADDAHGPLGGGRPTAGHADAGPYIEPRQGREAGPEFIHDEERSGIGLGGVFWSLLILLGIAGALLQAAYIYRVQLASEFPVLRPALERYCESLDCSVDYPRRIAQIAIMDSSLQAVRAGEDASEDGSRMMLNVVLRNNYDRPQQWPTISVELVDFSGTVAARRLLAPSDYLPQLSLQRPFPAKSEVRISVPITVAGVQINGYQLDKFFP